MNRKVILEAAVAVVVIMALGIGVSSGFSLARTENAVPEGVPRAISQSPNLDATPAADAATAAPGSTAVEASPYNASGEASFTAAGDLVRTQ